VLWSDEIYRIFGLSPEKYPPSYETYLKAVPAEEHTLIKKAFSGALYRREPYDIEHRVRKPGGVERQVHAQGEILYDASGRPVRMMGTLQDVTERRQAEQALAESERRYRLLAENVTDVIWTMGLQLRLTYVSPSIQWLTGYEPQEYLQLAPEQFLTPASLEEAVHKLREQLALDQEQRDPRRSETLELEIYCRDGSTVWTEVKASLLRDDQGRPTGILGVTRDITARRQLEAQLRHAQKMEVVGRLAGGLAHDFNNLLTAILSYSEFLLDGLDVREPAYQDLAEIKKAGERASLLTRQLLAFSRRQVMHPKPLQLNRLILDLVKMLHRVIGEDIHLETIYGAGLGWIMADPGQIEQVILNLTLNARDAMPQGGKLTIRTANVEIGEAEVRANPQLATGSYVLFEVTDTGYGMDLVTQSHIFEPFFTTKEVGKGTGLGLSTIYGIIQQSGGWITVRSEPGKGASFQILLPRVAHETAFSAPPEGTAESLAGHETILLVEDEDLVRGITGRILRQSGYQVLEARDGQEALQISQECREDIHLVLSDIVMPGINGRDLVCRLVSMRPEMKAMLMSGYAEESVMGRKILDDGVVFVQKPFQSRVLVQKIRELLNTA